MPRRISSNVYWKNVLDERDPYKILGITKNISHQGLVNRWLDLQDLFGKDRMLTDKEKQRFYSKINLAFAIIARKYFPRFLEHKNIKFVQNVSNRVKNLDSNYPVYVKIEAKINGKKVKGALHADWPDQLSSYKIYFIEGYDIEYIYNNGKWLNYNYKVWEDWLKWNDYIKKDGYGEPIDEGSEYEDLDPYEVLGIKSDSKQRDIKKAYRKAAIKYHPDKRKSPDSTEMMKRINWAYGVLVKGYNRRSSYTPYQRKETKPDFSKIPKFIHTHNIDVLKIDTKGNKIILDVDVHLEYPRRRDYPAYLTTSGTLTHYFERPSVLEVGWYDKKTNKDMVYIYENGKDTSRFDLKSKRRA